MHTWLEFPALHKEKHKYLEIKLLIMSLSDYSKAELNTLSKFFLADNFLKIMIFHNKTFDILYEFTNPMDYLESSKEAEKVVRTVDIMYTELAKSELSNGDVVLIYEGNRARILLILKKGGLSPFLEATMGNILEEFSKNFEFKYLKELKNWEDNKVKLEGVDDSIKEIMDTEQLLPHYAKYAGFDPDTKVGQYIYEAAQEFSKSVGYFYFRNLLYLTKEYVVEQARKIVIENPKKAKKEGIDPNNIDFPPDETFLIEMFNLKKKGLIRAIQLHELNTYSKIKY